jgi:phosphoglycerate dehydrogenase-like enzyme
LAEEPINVLITVPFDDSLVEKLQAVSPRLNITRRRPDDEGKLGDDLDRFEVLYAAGALPDPESVPNLRWVQLHWVGVESVIDHPLFEGDVELCTISGIQAISTAEYAMALVLAFAHRIPRILDHQRRIDWPKGRFQLFVPDELHGATLGIVGYGSIGRHLARLGKGFGMQVFAIKRDAMDPTDSGYTVPGVGDPEGDLPDRIYPPQALRSFLGECDYVVLLVPMTPETHHLINAETLRDMKNSAVLINLARGGVVDTRALIEALREEVIAGAALDVFEQEPLSEHSPLWETPNLILSPHIAGFTPHYNERATDIFAENLRRYVEGEPLVNRVDRQLGY